MRRVANASSEDEVRVLSSSLQVYLVRMPFGSRTTPWRGAWPSPFLLPSAPAASPLLAQTEPEPIGRYVFDVQGTVGATGQPNQVASGWASHHRGLPVESAGAQGRHPCLSASAGAR